MAFDVYAAVDGSRLRYSLAALATFSILAWFTMLTLFTLLFETGRWRSPGCWLRLPRWALGIAFRTMPDLLASCLPGHHPEPARRPARAWWPSLREMDMAAEPPGRRRPEAA